MGNNFHTPWVITTRFRASEMIIPPQELDTAITLNRPGIVSCDGVLSYDESTGTLSWDTQIRLYFVNENGATVLNTIAASSISLSAGQFAYVSRNPVTGSAVTIQAATLNPGSGSNFMTGLILVLAHRNPVTSKLTLINWSPTTAIVGTEIFDIHAYYPSTPGAGVLLLRVPIARTITFPANFAGSYGIASVAATATTDFDIQKNGSSIGTMSYAAAASVATFSSSASTFAAGDILSIVAPGTPDTTLSDPGAVLTGIR